ncbi:MAG: AI-2E family transporter [Paracoccus denitrificans]|nr:MAG: AI-2E family transporter [Paracoccus denitrificans]PZO83961.1 MAG: AI-2E family transporter [Paracoccus denitrificans]
MPSQRYQSSHRFPSRPETDGSPRRSVGWPVLGIFLILAFQFIALAREFLMPVTLAILLFFVFVPFRRLMERLHVGSTATAGIVTLGLIVATAGLGYVASGPIGQLTHNSDEISERLEQRMQNLRQNFKGIERVAERLEQLQGNKPTVVTPPPPAAPPAANTTADAPDPSTGVTTTSSDGRSQLTTMTTPEGTGTAATATMTTERPPAAGETGPVRTQQQIQVQVAPPTASPLMSILSVGPGIGGQIVFTLVLLFFLISSGDLLYLKVVQSFDSMKDKRGAYLALREIEDSLGAYLGAITIINACLGICIGLAMWAWGMPSPILWAVVAFLLNYIPYLGAIGGIIAALVVAIITYDDLLTPVLVAATYLSFTAIEGQLITPTFVSRRLQMNEVVVFLTVALWAWLWSVIGMVVAVPLLVVLRVLSDHIPGMEKFGNFLAGEQPPELEDDDEEHARDLVEDGNEATTLAEAKDVTRPDPSPQPDK